MEREQTSQLSARSIERATQTQAAFLCSIKPSSISRTSFSFSFQYLSPIGCVCEKQQRIRQIRHFFSLKFRNAQLYGC